VTPDACTTRSDGGLAVEVQQVARSLDGLYSARDASSRCYAFRDDLAARMDVEELASTD
jgi:hypothetical protein